MRSAQELYDYCFSNGYTAAQPEKLKMCCAGLVKKLNDNENVLLCFMGIHNYISATDYDGFYLYAITDQRFIMITSTLFGYKQRIFANHDITSIDCIAGMNLAKLKIGISGIGQLSVGMNEIIAKDIVRKLRELLPTLQSRPALKNQKTDVLQNSSDSTGKTPKKNKIWRIAAIAFILIGGLAAVGFVLHQLKVQNEIREKYQEAVKHYESGDYEYASFLLSQIPEGFGNRDAIYDELALYDETYLTALSLMEDADYTGAVKKLSELPDGYKDRNVIIDNIGIIEKLVENTWYDDRPDIGWYDECMFSLSAILDELKLVISEDEYSGTQYMNTYIDSIDIAELLDDGEAYIECDYRDNFNLNISEVDSGKYTTSTDYVTSTYFIQEHDNPIYERPYCMVAGCSYKAETTIIGLSGEPEYYCGKHAGFW